MNLNRKIETIRGDGIPGYNRKINEIIAALNWLMGVRAINGRPISESDQGPVFDLSQANMTQGGQGLDAFDPDGNKADWSLITCLNLETNQSFEIWIWTGQVAKNIQNIPWAFDPSNNQAGWIVCAQNSFWGTGQCSGGTMCQNYQNSVHSGSGRQRIANPANVPIVPPSSCTPRFFIEHAIFNQYEPSSQPYLVVTDVNPGVSGTWTFTITYDSVQIFSASGSLTTGPAPGYETVIYINPAGWQFDPGGLTGYSQGSKKWVYQYNGAASSNTNPPIIQTFTFSGDTTAGVAFWDIVFLTG
jgi:hypothetical protein